MSARAVKPQSLSPDAEQMLHSMDAAREGTLALVAELSDAELERVHSPIMSPLVWDLGHIAAYEDLWLAHRLGGMQLLRAGSRGALRRFRDAARGARGNRGARPAAMPPLSAPGCASAPPQVARDAGDSATGRSVRDGAPARAAALRDDAPDDGHRGSAPRGRAGRWPPAGRRSGWMSIPAGSFAMGAGAGGFAYDNERPRHTVERGAFQIARVPVTNASWMRFSEGGGYERREWWSDEGWAWKQEYDITHHPEIAAGSRRRHPPATSPGSRPTPSPERTTRAYPPSPSGSGRRPGSRQTILAGSGGRSPGSRRSVRCGSGRASHFDGYPGFPAYPYREYSEVFFGEHYRVLRGSSWATHPRVASPTFRNWDLPERRQIFAGVRLAGTGALMARTDQLHPADGAMIQIDSHLHERAGALTRRRCARRPDPAVQGTSAEALLRRARRRAVRPHLRAARVLPDARGARDPRAAAPPSWRRSPAQSSWWSSAPGTAAKTRVLLDAHAAGRHARALCARGRHREHGARMRRSS